MKVYVFLLSISIMLFAQDNSNNQLLENNQNSVSKKSPLVAALYSCLLPGMGELYAQDYSSGKYYTSADCMLLISYIGMNVYHTQLVNNYKTVAKQSANVSIGNKSSDYYSDLGIYNSVYEYNYYNYSKGYSNELYSESKDYWKWSSVDKRREYRNLWMSSRQVYNNYRFVISGMVLNRVVSMINAVRLTIRYNKNLQNQNTLGLGFDINQMPDYSPSLNFNISTSF